MNIHCVQVMVRNACSVGGMLEFDCCRIDIVLDYSFFDLLVDSVLLPFLSSSIKTSFLKKTQEYIYTNLFLKIIFFYCNLHCFLSFPFFFQ